LNYFQLLLVFDVASTILCALFLESERSMSGRWRWKVPLVN